MNERWTRKDQGITAGLVLFCGVMTFFLVRSEYFPESSILRQLPPQYVLDKILKFENVCALKLDWKDETIGGLTLRVTPGPRPSFKVGIQCIIPLLGEKPKLRFEMDCRLKANREVESFRIQGRWQEIDFQAASDDMNDKITVEVHGRGIETKREFFARDLLKSGNTKFLGSIPELSHGTSLLQAVNLSNGMGQWKINASSVRISRQNDTMEAYLVNARLDENSWAKLWVSPTGELLKLDSSLGVRAINEDFFEGVTAGGKPATKRNHG